MPRSGYYYATSGIHNGILFHTIQMLRFDNASANRNANSDVIDDRDGWIERQDTRKRPVILGDSDLDRKLISVHMSDHVANQINMKVINNFQSVFTLQYVNSRKVGYNSELRNNLISNEISEQTADSVKIGRASCRERV